VRVARAPRSRKASGRRSRQQVELPARYSKEYPVREGHNYVLNGIPIDVWERAKARAHAEDRSVRLVLIKALDLYGAGRLIF
jgi:predicted kinase